MDSEEFKMTERCSSEKREEKHKTSPLNIKLRNPFEAALIDRLDKPVFSPNVFTNITTPQKDSIKWSIDEVSVLMPAPIDVKSFHETDTPDSNKELVIQSKIEKYFSEHHIVPSPWQGESKALQRIVACTPNRFTVASKDVATQTMLTLPAILPPELEKALLPYFSQHGEDQERDNMSNSSLCRKLFDFGEIPSPKYTTPESVSSIALSLSPTSGFSEKFHEGLSHLIEECPISPIHPLSNNCERRIINVNTEIKDMSVDNCVPDQNQHLPDFSTENISLGVSPTTEKDCSTTSFSDWNLENKKVSVHFNEKSESTDIFMDISNPCTPKSRPNKLCQNISSRIEYKERNCDIISQENSLSMKKFRKLVYERDMDNRNLTEETEISSQNTQDTGYNTDITDSQPGYESPIKSALNSNNAWLDDVLCASTPSKRI